MGIDDIPIAREGELPSAAGHNAMREMLGRREAGPGMVVDSTGFHQRPMVSTRLEKYVELYDDLAPGGTAQAYPRNWGSGVEEYVTDTDADTFEVVDVFSRFRGRGRDETAPAEDDSDGTRGKHGSFGRVVARNGQWELDWLQPHAEQITATVDDTGHFDSGDTTITVDNVAVVAPVDAALLLTDVNQVYNIAKRIGVDNAVLTAEWNDGQERFDLDELEEQATEITCQVNDASYVSGDITVDTVVVTQPTANALLRAAVTSVAKPLDWDAATVEDNSVILARWNAATKKWDAVNMDCPSS